MNLASVKVFKVFNAVTIIKLPYLQKAHAQAQVQTQVQG